MKKKKEEANAKIFKTYKISGSPCFWKEGWFPIIKQDAPPHCSCQNTKNAAHKQPGQQAAAVPTRAAHNIIREIRYTVG